MQVRKDLAKYNFIGTEIAAVTYDDLINYVNWWLKNKETRSHHIAVINAYCATLAYTNERLAEIYSKADLVGPDGMPFVYWLRMVSGRACDQFDASSIVLRLAEESAQTHYRFYLYGGDKEVVIKMKRKLENLFPHIKIVGFKSPPFRPLTSDEDKKVCEEINALKPDIICVGLGTPKQDYWIDDHITKIYGAVFIPCGAVFDFFGGRIKRAPDIISKLGIEWLYRLFGKDFKRLWYRYTVMNIIFLWFFALQLLGLKVNKSQTLIRPE